MKFVLFAGFVFLASCAPTETVNTAQQSRYDNMTISQLWLLQNSSQSALELAVVEAELGSRGQTTYGAQYLGKRTSAAYGKKLYSRNSTGGNDIKNCSDFSSSAAAQSYFLGAGGPVRDPNNLDLDGDGLACEWGTDLNQIASRNAAPVIVPRAIYRAATCHRGPRGGSYTITASGTKDYNGC